MSHKTTDAKAVAKPRKSSAPAAARDRPAGTARIGGVTIKLAPLPPSKKGKAIREAVRAYYAARRA